MRESKDARLEKKYHCEEQSDDAILDYKTEIAALLLVSRNDKKIILIMRSYFALGIKSWLPFLSLNEAIVS
jgi:hypothetical protein